MRTPIIAGNWKMHKNVAESVAFVKDLAPALASFKSVERVVAPTFVALFSVAEVLKETEIKVSAQQVHWEVSGAFTSQISPTMLKGIAQYVIIGHSECRQYLNETDETVNRKLKACLTHDLTPIVAVGESRELRESGQADAFVKQQIHRAYQDVTANDAEKTVIAYEPIWAIGTGLNADAETAQMMIGGTIRQTLREIYGDATAEKIRIQYGGSVKPSNMLEYMQQPDIDGGLVGGASLNINDFVDLVRISAQAKG